ncbi:MAG: Rrf2 family transcriptional regulator [bacterium]
MVPKFYINKRMSVPEMRDQFNINTRTLTPALTRLVHAGVLKSKIGGNDRGYILARDPKTISLYEIAHITQGDLQMRCCADVIDNCSECFLNKGQHCKLFNKLNKALLHVKEELENISLFDQYSNGIKQNI